MPALTDHHSATSTKLLLIGDSGAGKTGALACLAASGYNLRILDFDNGLDILKGYLTGVSPYTTKDPSAASRVHSLTCTDKRKLVGSSLVPVKAEAWERACRALYEWKELSPDGKSTVVDLGKIETWGEKDVLVIDSLSTAAEAALNHHLGLNGKLGASRTSNEGRRDIGATQNLVRSLLQMLYSDSIKCNVVINAHITLVTESGMSPQSEEAKGEADTARGYPAALGRALSPHIPRYFNSVLLLDVEGRGASARHFIYTKSRGNILVKTSAPLRVREKYPIGWGLAEYFAAVRGEPHG